MPYNSSCFLAEEGQRYALWQRSLRFRRGVRGVIFRSNLQKVSDQQEILRRTIPKWRICQRSFSNGFLPICRSTNGLRSVKWENLTAKPSLTSCKDGLQNRSRYCVRYPKKKHCKFFGTLRKHRRRRCSINRLQSP